jgi:hypothetical protein
MNLALLNRLRILFSNPKAKKILLSSNYKEKKTKTNLGVAVRDEDGRNGSEDELLHERVGFVQGGWRQQLERRVLRC